MELEIITEPITNHNTTQDRISIHPRYRFGLHPLFKLSLFILLNIGAFLPELKYYREMFLLLELYMAYLVHLHFYEVSGFFKFLLLNFIGLYILFYFVEYDFWKAAIYFYEYSLSVVIMFIGTFIFTKATPARELLIALRLIHIPQGLALGFTVALTFLPLLTEKFRKIMAFQQARGYKFRIHHLGPIIIPGLLEILDLATNLAISLESRGFQVTQTK